MSIVCFKDGTMAADTRAIHDDAGIVRTTKLMRKRIGRREHLLGLAGDVSYAMLFCEWYGSGKPMPDQLKSIPEEKKFSVLIYAGKKLYEADGICRPLEVESRFYAIGSGSQAALGAMRAGASALQAAKIACEIDSACGLPIQTMVLPTKLRGVYV